MEISKGAIGVLAALSVAAGAGGVYLMTGGREAAAPAADTADAPVSPEPVTPLVGQPGAVAPHTAADDAAPDRIATPRLPQAGRAAQRPPATPGPVDEAPSVPHVEAQPVAPPPLDPPREVEPEFERAAEPVAPQFEELIVPADSVVGLQVETTVTSERARVEDEVVAHVTRDVRVGDRVAIPAGSTAHGEVTLVERGGRLRERARLGVRFTSIVLADGTRIPLETDIVYREGSSPGGESAAKIGGGAIGGAIIGGILGGARGAVIGGSAGAGAGTAAVLAGGRNPATLPSGSPVTVRLIEPTSVIVER